MKKPTRADLAVEVEELKRHVRHLEGRIAGQKSQLTYMHNERRVHNVRVAARHQGRESLLLQQLRDSQQSLYGWKHEAEKHQAELRRLRAAAP